MAATLKKPATAPTSPSDAPPTGSSPPARPRVPLTQGLAAAEKPTADSASAPQPGAAGLPSAPPARSADAAPHDAHAPQSGSDGRSAGSTAPTGGTEPAAPIRTPRGLRWLDGLLRIINLPFAFLPPVVRRPIGWIALVTIGMALLFVVLSQALRKPSAIDALRAAAERIRSGGAEAAAPVAPPPKSAH